MVVDDILTASGITYRRTRFPRPPTGTYAVYTDDMTADGPDGLNRVYTHNYTIELYAPAPDPDSEAALEAALDDAGQHYTKEDSYWIQEEQLYQTLYEFTFYEKRRG